MVDRPTTLMLIIVVIMFRPFSTFTRAEVLDASDRERERGHALETLVGGADEVVDARLIQVDGDRSEAAHRVHEVGSIWRDKVTADAVTQGDSWRGDTQRGQQLIQWQGDSRCHDTHRHITGHG